LQAQCHQFGNDGETQGHSGSIPIVILARYGGDTVGFCKEMPFTAWCFSTDIIEDLEIDDESIPKACYLV
jgi:hypothetical protein